MEIFGAMTPQKRSSKLLSKALFYKSKGMMVLNILEFSLKSGISSLK